MLATFDRLAALLLLALLAPLRLLGLQRQAWSGLWEVLCGRRVLVGPRPRAPGESPSPRRAAALERCAPGWLSTAALRERMNVGFGEADEADWEDASERSLRRTLTTLARAGLVAAFGGEARDEAGAGRLELLGLPVDNLRMEEAIASIAAALGGPRPAQMAFINADCVNISARDAGYREALWGCERVFADGIGMKWAAAALGSPLRENVNGTDLFPRLMRDGRLAGRRVFLYGGRPGVAAEVAAWLAREAPEVVVCGHEHGYGEDAAAAVERIRAARPELLLVALGAPRQERWLAAQLEATGAAVGIGVGGLFDFVAGRIPRAPRGWRDCGLEWVWRLLQEPRRMWRRYLIGNGVFLARLALRRLRGERARPLAAAR